MVKLFVYPEAVSPDVHMHPAWRKFVDYVEHKYEDVLFNKHKQTYEGFIARTHMFKCLLDQELAAYQACVSQDESDRSSHSLSLDFPTQDELTAFLLAWS